MSKIDAGKMEIHEENVDLAQLMEDSLALVRDHALRGGISLEVYDASRGQVIWADRRLLKQILLNLLSNAIKFTLPGGEVTGGVVWTETDVGFSVRDTGIGMSPDDLEVAMSPYGQIDSRVSRKHYGTGLGLPISQSLAKMHKGALVVESKLGRGTSISLLLPVSRKVMPTAAAGSP